MSSITVVGAQWGDEGKGKIVDWLSAHADLVVRFQGGHNAGHTLVIDGVTHKLSLLPSGIVRASCLSVIGNGVVLDPWALLAEMATLREQGVRIDPDRLAIAENVCLILPVHQQLDRLREDRSGAGKIGTTGRGIGPAYEDKVARRAVRLCDLADRALLETRLDALLEHHDLLRRGMEQPPVDRAELTRQLLEIAPQVLPYARPVWQDLQTARNAGKHILFEGAQGVMLDVDHGTYPFVTSSSTVPGQAATGSGCGPDAAGYVLGIVKAYTTRVGSGPFPTEQDNADGAQLGERGREFGTVTGRKRRCGWFDAVQVRQAAAISGLHGLALMKLDVLDGFGELRICTGYRLDGAPWDHLPPAAAAQSRLEPVWEILPGWRETTAGIRRWEDLPENAQGYVQRLEELVGVPVAIVSTSPEREDTIRRPVSETLFSRFA